MTSPNPTPPVCAQVSLQMIDFLYDELPAPARQDFERHLETCAACRTDVTALRQALGVTRTALQGPLSQNPPPQVHARALQAAHAHATRGSKTKRPEAPGAFINRWLRIPWLLPAFGAASILLIVFITRKVTVDPNAVDKPFEKSNETSALPSFPSTPLREIPSAEAQAERLDPDHNPSEIALPQKGVGKAKRDSSKRRVRSDHEVTARPAPLRPREIVGPEHEEAGVQKRIAEKALEAKWAAPPSHWVEQKADTALDERDNSAPEQGRSSRGAAAQATHPPRSQPGPKPALAAGPAALPEQPADLSNDESRAENGSDRSLEESLRRADRAFLEKRWITAEIAYRELIRRFPHHKDKPHWQERIRSAIAARALEKLP